MTHGRAEEAGGTDRQPSQIVQRGYDAAANTHLEWINRIEGDPRMHYVARLMDCLQPGARVLEMGCGAGVPITAALASRFEVVGIDLSAAQLALARERVPRATFIQADMSTFISEKPLDAVVAAYSITHVPRNTHAALFSRIASWLRPGGFFLASLGAGGCPDTVEEWLGVPMFFSSFDAARNRQLLRAAGFELIIDDVVTMQEPEGPATFLWVLCRRTIPTE
ncbi:MAG: class I SAM-dependent methyltransferase [Actinomycetes bacterium]